MGSADLLLHPVRLRIIKVFLGDRKLTTGQLVTELADVSAGSVYRHVGLLAKAGVLHVVAERRVRGVVERTYALRADAARLDADTVAAMTPEEHTQAFLAFVAGLLDDFDRYITGRPDPLRGDAGYRVAGMWLNDAELAEFLQDLTAIALPRLKNQPGDGRRRRTLYSVLLPEPEESS